MGGIVLVIVVIFTNVIIRKVATVALKLTGLDERTASFQALSALTGTGFTTRESELIISQPMRRRIVSILMIVGNAGLIAVIAGLASSFLTITSPWSTLRFVILIVAIYLIFRMATHTRLARFLSKKIEEKLREKYKLQKRSIRQILDLGEDSGLAEVTLHEESSCVGKTLAACDLIKRKILILAIERGKERILIPPKDHKFHAGDNLICYGSFAELRKIA